MAVIQLDYNFHQNCALRDLMNSTAFISSTTTLSLCTVNSTHMVVQKGQHIKIYLYTSRLTYLHQDLFIYTKIYLYKSRYIHIH